MRIGRGIVHQDVDPTEALDHLVDEALGILGTAHVSGHRCDGSGMTRVDSIRRRLEPLRLPAGNDYAGTMVGQGKGGRLANATASACHDRHATGQVEIRHGKILSAAMDFDHSPKVKALQKKLDDFMGEFIYPNQQRYREQTAGDDRWRPSALIEALKPKARAAGLWNLFLPDSPQGGGLTNLEYAPLCEIMGRVPWAPEVFNCSAPDTGNMEILDRYGTPEQKDRWLRPLLDRPGSAGPWPNSPLYAADRAGGSRPRTDVQTS